MKVPRTRLALLLLLAACSGRDMDDQEKYEPYEAAALFADGSAMQHPVPGTVARDQPQLWAQLRERPPLDRLRCAMPATG